MATITVIASGKVFADAGIVFDSGTTPVLGDNVIHPNGFTLELDGDWVFGTGLRSTSITVANSSYKLEGKLKFSRLVNSSLAVDGQIIRTDGTISEIDMGTELDPIPAGITAHWEFNPQNDSYITGYVYGLYATYSGVGHLKINAVSAQFRNRNTHLIGQVLTGASTFTVADATGWQVGDSLWITPTYVTNASPMSLATSEEVVISSISGNNITIVGTLSNKHGYTNPLDDTSAVVINLTSNVTIGTNSGKHWYGFWVKRGETIFKNVEFKNINSGYNYHMGLKLESSFINGLSHKFDSCAFWSDMSQQTSINFSGFLCAYSPRKSLSPMMNDSCMVSKKRASGKYISAHIYAYYGGYSTLYENIVSCAGDMYTNSSFVAYQQPAIFKNCKAVGATVGFNLHNNVDAKADGCYAIGCREIGNTYNGSAQFTDMKLRFCNTIARFQNGWRVKATYNRTDFEDRHINRPNIYDYVIQPSTTVPDGCEINVININNDSNKNIWFRTYGEYYQNFTQLKNSSSNIILNSYYTDPLTPLEYIAPKFKATLGDSLPVSAYIMNLSGTSYVGNLIIKIRQGSSIITSKTYDLTTFTVDSWNFIDINGVATLTGDVEVIFELDGLQSKIVLTDIFNPPTINELSQANAVWQDQKGKDVLQLLDDNQALIISGHLHG